MNDQPSQNPIRVITVTVVLLLFTFGFIAILVSTGASRTSDIPFTTFVLTTVKHSAGGLIALLTALVMMVRAVMGVSLDRLTPLILPFLAGIALATMHWSAPLAIGALGVMIVVKQILANRRTVTEGRENAE